MAHGSHRGCVAVQVQALDESAAAALKAEIEESKAHEEKALEAAMRRAKASVPFLLIDGAEGVNALTVNGLWKLVDDEQGGIVYRKDGEDYYIYYSVSGQWTVGDRSRKDAKEAAGNACTEVMEADSLPIDASSWQVFDGKELQKQSLRVRWGLSGCFGLGAEWGGPRSIIAKWRISFFLWRRICRWPHYSYNCDGARARAGTHFSYHYQSSLLVIRYQVLIIRY